MAERLLTMTENKSKIVLTDAEKEIKHFLNLIQKPGFNINEMFLENFSRIYAETVMKSTRFQDMGIYFKNITDGKSERGTLLGSMSVDEEKKKVNLGMNLGFYIDKLDFNSDDGEKRLLAAYRFVRTLNHELTHTMQDLEIGQRFIPSVNGGYTILDKLKFVREHKAQRTDREYFYEENYSDTNVEGDANKKSVIKTGIQLFRIFPKDTMPKSLQEKIIEDVVESPELHEVDYNAMSYDKGKKQSREEVTRKYADELMADSIKPGEFGKHNPVIDVNPILAFEYNEDGTPKSYTQLLRDRDECIKSTFDNQKIREDTRVELLCQYSEAYSQLLINSLRRSEPEEIVEVRKMIGDDAFLESLNFTLLGKSLEATRFVDKHAEYLDVFEYLCPNDRLDAFRKIKHSIEDLDKKAGIEARFEKRVDPETQKESIVDAAYTLCTPEIAFVGKIADQIVETKDMYKDQMYEKTRSSRSDYIRKMDEYAMERKIDLQLDHEERKARKERGEKIEVPAEVLEEDKEKYTVPIPSKTYVSQKLAGYLYKTCLEGHTYDHYDEMKSKKAAQKAKEAQKEREAQNASGKTVDVEFKPSETKDTKPEVKEAAKPTKTRRTIVGFVKGIFNFNKARPLTDGSKYSQTRIEGEEAEILSNEEELNRRLSSHRVYVGALKERINKQKEMCIELKEIEPSLTKSENQKVIEEQIGIIESFERMQQGIKRKGEELAHVK